MFHYEADSDFSFLTSNSEIMDKIDITITPRSDSDIPITLICNWGYPTSKYLQNPSVKITETNANHKLVNKPVYVADFRGVIPPGLESFFSELHELINIDSFGGQYRNINAPEPYILSERINHMGEYLFVIIAESIIEDNWYVEKLNEIEFFFVDFIIFIGFVLNFLKLYYLVLFLFILVLLILMNFYLVMDLLLMDMILLVLNLLLIILLKWEKIENNIIEIITLGNHNHYVKVLKHI